MPDDKDTMERAKEIFVYGPLGLAMYMRDSAPSFLKVFVARGRAEVEQRKKVVGEHLGQARDAGESATESGAPQVLRLVTDGLTRLKETAEGALGTLSGLSDDASSPPDASGPKMASGPTTTTSAHGSPASSGASSGGTSTAGGDAGLAIAEYDDLSASQVVDRLEGLGAVDLEAIRSHEVAHRARATILGKIDQLTRAG